MDAYIKCSTSSGLVALANGRRFYNMPLEGWRHGEIKFKAAQLLHYSTVAPFADLELVRKHDVYVGTLIEILDDGFCVMFPMRSDLTGTHYCLITDYAITEEGTIFEVVNAHRAEEMIQWLPWKALNLYASDDNTSFPLAYVLKPQNYDKLSA